MEKIKLIIMNDRIIKYNNPFNEKSCDYISKGTYTFDEGKIYGIVSEHGGGGEGISRLLSGESSLVNETIFVNGEQVLCLDDIGWYIGKQMYSKGIIKRELSVRESLTLAIKKYNRFNNIGEIIKLFHLSDDKLDYKFSNNTLWEMWRFSLALGYACEKKIFCFPWMNSLTFYDCMYNSGVFRFFKMFKENGFIIILPTSRKENLKKLADKAIEINNPRFHHIISETKYFNDCF